METTFSASYSFARSTNLEHAWLNEDESTLILRFKTRATLYRYTAREDSPVTAKQAFGQLIREDAKEGGSPTTWLNSHIKPNFDCEKEEPGKSGECRLCGSEDVQGDGLCAKCLLNELSEGAA